MGLSLREDASVFQLECDRSRARYGVILLAFRFDPSDASDGFGELEAAESVPPVVSKKKKVPKIATCSTLKIVFVSFCRIRDTTKTQVEYRVTSN